MDSLEQIAEAIRDFFNRSPRAVVVEDGALLFDFASARYAVKVEHGKCVLQMWSPERNTVRRVVSAERKSDGLRLKVQRFGQAKLSNLTLAGDPDRRTPSERRVARRSYAARLRAFLERRFAGWTIEQFSSDADLRRSFSAVYTRALLRQGSTSFALLGVNSQENQAAIDGALTFGILWLDYCRERTTGRASHVEGLKILVPPKTGALLRERMAHLNHAAARWEIFEWDERGGSLLDLEPGDRGNIDSRLVRHADEQAARERFAASIQQIAELATGVPLELQVRSAGELSFRLHGLEVARVRLEVQPGSFQPVEQISFGAGANETVLTDANRGEFSGLLATAAGIRTAGGDRKHPLWRMAPERWLESLVARDIGVLDQRFKGMPVYSQVPAIAGGDRGVIDLLTATVEGRLAVIEIKADDDIHLPLQGVDYWARVEWHRARGEFEKHGYFPQLPLSDRPPLLLLVCPALRVHSSTDTLFRYLSPEIEVSLVALDEHWREELRVIFRKRPERRAAVPY